MQALIARRRRRGVHDRRQPPGVRRARARSPAGRDARARADRRRTITATSRCSTTRPPRRSARFRELLLAMSYDDPRGPAAARSRGPQGSGSPGATRATRCSSARSIASARSRLPGADGAALRVGHDDRAIDLGDLGLDAAAHLLVKRALRGVAVGDRSSCAGDRPTLACICRRGAARKATRSSGDRRQARRSSRAAARTPAAGAAPSVRAADRRAAGRRRRAPAARAGGSPRAARWSRPARPTFDFPLADKDAVWADEAARLYAQAAAAQWDPGDRDPLGRARSSTPTRSRTRSCRS